MVRGIIKEMVFEIQIEPVAIKNFGQFYAFAQDFILNHYLDYPPKLRKKYLELEFDPKIIKKRIKKGEDLILIAWVKEKVVGFLVNSFESGGCAHLQWFGVDKNYRNSGIGSRLLKEMEKKIIEKKYHFVILWTESQSNIEYYKKRGYDLVGLQKQSWFGQDEYLMQKNLCPPFLKELGVK